ncbi:zinc finger protein 260-like isoform X8 [Battus philenor]|uniref:zinc finger protein 260-like isoform X8 n=1 Tax=Battus philenor TaxID=42288 RepID=UPI0035D1168E
MATKTTEWRPGPTVCRCCLAEGCYKDISTEYFWMGKREVYAEMLANTFDLSIAYSQSGGPYSNSRLICEPCISRLRDAADFKRQVVECEKTFLQHLDPSCSADTVVNVSAVVPLEDDREVKIEGVKVERLGSEDELDDSANFNNDDDDDDDLDDQPLTKLASKCSKKDSVDLLDIIDNAKVADKRKSTVKVKATPVKKVKMKKEAKATASKAKPEKKKKETVLVSHKQKAKRNAEVVLQCSTVYPFRLRGKYMLCVYCCDEFSEPAAYRRHMDETHQRFSVATAFAHCGKGREYLKVDCSNIKCRLCSQPCDSLQEIAQHINIYHPTSKLDIKYDIGLQPYKIDKDKWHCYLCDMKFPSITKLCRHTTSHYQKFTCESCGRCYLSSEALNYHIRCNHSAQPQCRKCWQKFPSLEMKREHMRRSKSCWTFCCMDCGERFMSWECKQKHMVQVHGQPNTTYTCPDCGEIFEKRKIFYNHFKMNHTDENYICSCCGMKCGSRLQLEDHRLVHTGEKPYECGVCKKTFTRKKSLTQHMWIHSETKRFSCPVCDKQFAQKVSLKGHLKSHHPEISNE